MVFLACVLAFLACMLSALSWLTGRKSWLRSLVLALVEAVSEFEFGDHGD